MGRRIREEEHEVCGFQSSSRRCAIHTLAREVSEMHSLLATSWYLCYARRQIANWSRLPSAGGMDPTACTRYSSLLHRDFCFLVPSSTAFPLGSRSASKSTSRNKERNSIPRWLDRSAFRDIPLARTLMGTKLPMLVLSNLVSWAQP